MSSRRLIAAADDSVEVLRLDEILAGPRDVVAGHRTDTTGLIHLDLWAVVADERLVVDMADELPKAAGYLAKHELVNPLAGLGDLGVAVDGRQGLGGDGVNLASLGVTNVAQSSSVTVGWSVWSRGMMIPVPISSLTTWSSAGISLPILRPS